MINSNLIKETLRQTERVLNDFRDWIDQQAHFFIFPFTLQGCVNVTETGLKPEAINISDYTFFSKVITGDHPLVAAWEESTYFIASEREDGRAYRYSFMQNEIGAKKSYVVGRFFKGAVESDVQGMMIGSGNLSDVEMTSLQESQSFTLLTTESLTKEDI